jgi:hypothetical protein
LDEKESEVYLGNIDRLFGETIDLQKGARHENKRTARVVFLQQMKANKPIHVNGEKSAGLKAQGPFLAYYVVEPFRRSFTKMLRIPVVETMTDDEAAQTARAFVVQNRLCRITEDDAIGPVEVLSLRRQQLEPDKGLGEKLTLFHRVEFARVFRGLRVFGSKQIVCLHPQSKEILGYKSVDWTPIDQSTQMKAELASADEVVARISKEFDAPDAKYVVREVELGFLQSKGVISPALAVHCVRRLARSDTHPMQETFIVSLLKSSVSERISPSSRPRSTK